MPRVIAACAAGCLNQRLLPSTVFTGILTWAQLCLIIVSRGISNALTRRRASASSSSRPALSLGENALPRVSIFSRVDGTLAASFGDRATSTDGWRDDRYGMVWLTPLALLFVALGTATAASLVMPWVAPLLVNAEAMFDEGCVRDDVVLQVGRLQEVLGDTRNSSSINRGACH